MKKYQQSRSVNIEISVTRQRSVPGRDELNHFWASTLGSTQACPRKGHVVSYSYTRSREPVIQIKFAPGDYCSSHCFLEILHMSQGTLFRRVGAYSLFERPLDPYHKDNVTDNRFQNHY